MSCSSNMRIYTRWYCSSSYNCYNAVTELRACLHGGGGPQIGEVTCGGSPHLSCKRHQIKLRDYMDRRVTSPIWSPPPPCKQTLSKAPFAHLLLDQHWEAHGYVADKVYFRECNPLLQGLGPVVQSLISANRGFNFNPGFFFCPIAFPQIIFLSFLAYPIIKLWTKRNKLNLPTKPWVILNHHWTTGTRWEPLPSPPLTSWGPFTNC